LISPVNGAHSRPVDLTSANDFIVALKRLGAEGVAQRLDSLSTQERLILELMARGNGNKHIALLLQVQIATIKSHNSRIFRKLEVNSRVQATVFWLWGRMVIDRSGPSEFTVDGVVERLWNDDLNFTF